MNYSIEKLTEKVKNLLLDTSESKFSNEAFLIFCKTMERVFSELQKDEEETTTVAPIEMDIDTYILSKMKETGKEGVFRSRGQIPVSFLLEHNIGEVLGIKDEDYYAVRGEFLKHTKLFEPQPKSPDYLKFK